MMLALGSMPATAQSVAGTAQARAHVYLLRGLMNIFSLGMDSLAEELSKRGVYATVSNHSEWKVFARRPAHDAISATINWGTMIKAETMSEEKASLLNTSASPASGSIDALPS